MKSMLVLLLAFIFNVSNRYLTKSVVQGNKVVGVFPDRVYHLYDEEKIFASAEDLCEERDGYLAVIKDPADLAIISQNLFEDYSRPIEDEARNITQFYWIGLERNERKKWGFTDGSPYRAATRLAFTPWNKSEEKDYNCAGIVTAGLEAPTLRQQDCFYKAPFICQYDVRPCIPKMLLDAPVRTSPDDVYRVCDTEAAQSQRQRISNDECNCPAGNVAHTFMDKVYCNSQNWYNSAVCISGCPPPPIPSNGVLIDPLQTYWQGDKITVMCLDGNASEVAIYKYQISLRCMEGGLWFGANIDKLCTDSIDLNNGNLKTAALKRYVMETGSMTELQCGFPGQIEGIKPQSWLWYKGSKLLSDVDKNKYTVEKETGTLKIDKFSTSSTGSYTCFGRYKGTLLSGHSYFVSIPSADYNTSGSASFKISLMFLDVRLLVSLFLTVLYKVC